MAFKAGLVGLFLGATLASPAPAPEQLELDPKTTHLTLNYPRSYDFTALLRGGEPLGTFPNYPCQGSIWDTLSIPGGRTKLQAGQEHEAQLEGFTAHTGGSCQIAISPDQPPKKNSEFKVVTSIHGACPGAVEGKLQPQKFKLPAEAANGKYTLAMTWFPQVPRSGKPEMWMFCSPIEIVGSEYKKKPKKAGKGWLKHLPTLFIANVNVEGFDLESEQWRDENNFNAGGYGPWGRWNRHVCLTRPNSEVKFPYPGDTVYRNLKYGQRAKLHEPIGDGCWTEEQPVKKLEDWNEIKYDGKKKRDLSESAEQNDEFPHERMLPATGNAGPPSPTSTPTSSSSSSTPVTTPYTTTFVTTVTVVGRSSTSDAMFGPRTYTYTSTRTLTEVQVVSPTPTTPYTTVHRTTVVEIAQ
ncbi:hypothetical protein HDK90DRAFT_455348, partial [Phyllosticta capitalensis]